MIQHSRKTKETDINLSLNLYGSGKASIDTQVGFFDHMLESFCKHALLDLEIRCIGDTHVDDHHSVEDVGIVLAKALNEAIYPVSAMERFGNATVVMDEASVTCDIDLSNRAYLHYDLGVEGSVGRFEVELVEEFFRAIAFNAPFTLHLVCNRGKNKHHIVEAAFKAFAVALRRAIAHNERIKTPSTKGTL
ncbi:MAG: imidazoleglycerol-phosphate dehydratase HisB [Campylobacterota bacterium]